MQTIAEQRAARALAIAQLAIQLRVQFGDGSNNVNSAVMSADDLLVAAENLIAKKYGEFR